MANCARHLFQNFRFTIKYSYMPNEWIQQWIQFKKSCQIRERERHAFAWQFYHIKFSPFWRRVLNITIFCIKWMFFKREIFVKRYILSYNKLSANTWNTKLIQMHLKVSKLISNNFFYRPVQILKTKVWNIHGHMMLRVFHHVNNKLTHGVSNAGTRSAFAVKRKKWTVI